MKRVRAAACGLLTVLVASVAADSRIDRPHAVSDPGYGAILYHYYQQHWFAAMSEALLALDSGTLPSQRQQAEVLLGALYAHYGMPDEAEQLFHRLLEESVDPSLAPQVWLHLAELHYRRGRYPQALMLLDERIGEPPAERAQAWHALRTRTLMRLGRFEETGAALAALEQDRLSAYLRYNLAVSRINQGDGEPGVALLWQVANLAPGDEETNALKDRAMLALGVHYLRSGDPQRARSVLRAARLDGPYSETALLLHARAWLDSDEPVRALGSLQALGRRSLQFEETQEALLSLPWLYQLLGDRAQAASAYRDAIQRYTEHYRYLAELEAHIHAGQWFAELVQAPAWSTAMDPLPPFVPQRVESFATFRHLFASHAFHGLWRDYHEHLRQQHLLLQWQQRLPALEAVLMAQVRKHQEQAPLALEVLAAIEQAGWSLQRDALQARFERGRDEGDLSMFASEDEARLLAAMEEAERLIARWPDRISDEIRARFALQKGLLLWQLKENAVPRHWQREQALRQLGPLLDDMDQLVLRVRTAAAGDGARVALQGEQLAVLHRDIARLHQQGQQLLARQQTRMEALALAGIQRTRERLRAFTAESWAGLADLENAVLREQRQGRAADGGDRSAE